MTRQIPINGAAVIEDSSNDGYIEVAPDVAYKRLLFVNVVFLGTPDAWVLIDAGIAASASFIRRAAEERFGKGATPHAIILTHGHFDHSGALEALNDSWNVPIYAHTKELGYLDGSTSYPPPDPSVGGGMMSLLSSFFPRGPIKVSNLHELSDNNSVPFLPAWRWIATPGHSPGHISLWRESDKMLVSGDAVITTAQESAYGAITQESEIHGPPQYFTPDWIAAEQSVAALAALNPKTIVPGHGRAMEGDVMEKGLQTLTKKFRQVAVPKQGRYVKKKSKEDSHREEAQLPLIDENISSETSGVQRTVPPR